LIKNVLSAGLKNGSLLTLTTTAAILAVSANENDGAWGAINSISHMVYGDDEAYSNSFEPKQSSIGIAINGTAMVVWAIIYEVLFGKVKFPRSAATAAAYTAGAYIVDYYLVPKQYTPGIEQKISKKGIFGIYAILALTLFATSFWSRHRR
jgi:hypothetical protein